MADQFVAEIRVFPFNFAPVGWAMCNGQIMPISQNTALFSLLGTQYGGDGKSNFALPNLQGSFALGMGDGPGLTPREIGETGGEPAVTLLASQMPAHTHAVACAGAVGAPNPSGAVFASTPEGQPAAYAPSGSGAVAMSPAAVTRVGGGLPHQNMPPFTVLNFCIALQGIFPSRS